jgi:hypothetical protein
MQSRPNETNDEETAPPSNSRRIAAALVASPSVWPEGVLSAAPRRISSARIHYRTSSR